MQPAAPSRKQRLPVRQTKSPPLTAANDAPENVERLAGLASNARQTIARGPAMPGGVWNLDDPLPTRNRRQLILRDPYPEEYQWRSAPHLISNCYERCPNTSERCLTNSECFLTLSECFQTLSEYFRALPNAVRMLPNAVRMLPNAVRLLPNAS